MNLAILFALAATLGVTPGSSVKMSRASMAPMEKAFDRQIEHLNVTDPVLLLGPTRSMYLAGYGAVFSTEVNLVANANISPFHPTYSKDELAKIKAKKQERIGMLKTQMRDMLVNTAWALDNLPVEEQLVLGVDIFYFSWEDSAGLPKQIIMHAARRALIQTPRTDTAALDAAIRTEEF